MLIVGNVDVSAELLKSAEQLAGEVDSGVKYVVVPLGIAGELIWKNLPPRIIRFVAAVRPEAIVISRQKDSGPLSIEHVLEQFETQDSLIAVTSPLDAPLGTVGLPQLAPRSRPLSHEESARLAQIGDSSSTGVALRAGLAQIRNDLEQSHELAQTIEGVGKLHLGDYWHAIMHRREPDYFNAKYWFRRVGPHPIMQKLSAAANPILSQSDLPELSNWKKKLIRDQWDAMSFVDFCQEGASDEESPIGIVARQIQWLEMLFLLQVCVEHSKLTQCHDSPESRLKLG